MDRVRRPWSLRRRLVALLLALTALMWGTSAAVIYWQANKESDELFDQSLSETAHLLLALAERGIASGTASESAPLVESAQGEHSTYLFFQIWNSRGGLVYRSLGAPAKPFMAASAGGFGWTTLQGHRWRSYSAWNEARTLQIQVGEPIHHRKEISGGFAYRLGLFALVTIPLTGLLIWWIVHAAFAPLRRSAGEVAARAPNDLREVGSEGAPIEVAPLLLALNGLLARVRHTLLHEQRFTADAAHELRTPLAAIKTNLQVLRRARNPDEGREAVEGLSASVERSSHLIDQLLTLARFDPERVAVQPFLQVDLGELVNGQVREHAAFALARGVVLRAEPRPVIVTGHAASMVVLLRNLVDNALRYTQAGGTVVVASTVGAAGPELIVSDSGPGIEEAERQRIFDRFFSLPGNASKGSGLGLSIVRRIAEVHGANIELRPGLEGRGITFAVCFVSPDPARG